MSQQTLNDPLSGAEIKEIVLDRIRQQMDKDCTLNDDISYAGFRLDFYLNIGFLRAPNKDTLVWGITAQGESNGSTPEVISGTYETDIPNEARIDHDLGIPTLVDTPAGKEKRRIRIPNDPNRGGKRAHPGTKTAE